jgi:hypothetical protein
MAEIETDGIWPNLAAIGSLADDYTGHRWWQTPQQSPQPTEPREPRAESDGLRCNVMGEEVPMNEEGAGTMIRDKGKAREVVKSNVGGKRKAKSRARKQDMVLTESDDENGNAGDLGTIFVQHPRSPERPTIRIRIPANAQPIPQSPTPPTMPACQSCTRKKIACVREQTKTSRASRSSKACRACHKSKTKCVFLPENAEGRDDPVAAVPSPNAEASSSQKQPRASSPSDPDTRSSKKPRIILGPPLEEDPKPPAKSQPRQKQPPKQGKRKCSLARLQIRSDIDLQRVKLSFLSRGVRSRGRSPRSLLRQLNRLQWYLLGMLARRWWRNAFAR